MCGFEETKESKPVKVKAEPKMPSKQKINAAVTKVLSKLPRKTSSSVNDLAFKVEDHLVMFSTELRDRVIQLVRASHARKGHFRISKSGSVRLA